MAAPILSPIERFESKFIPEPNSGCWLWTDALNTWGYGQFWWNRENVAAHRAAWLRYYILD